MQRSSPSNRRTGMCQETRYPKLLTMNDDDNDDEDKDDNDVEEKEKEGDDENHYEDVS